MIWVESEHIIVKVKIEQGQDWGRDRMSKSGVGVGCRVRI